MTLGWDNLAADPTTTILLRHGDTRLSPEHRFSGQRDLPLSDSGTRQAKAAACRLAAGTPIDAMVSPHCNVLSTRPPLRLPSLA